MYTSVRHRLGLATSRGSAFVVPLPSISRANSARAIAPAPAPPFTLPFAFSKGLRRAARALAPDAGAGKRPLGQSPWGSGTAEQMLFKHYPQAGRVISPLRRGLFLLRFPPQQGGSTADMLPQGGATK